MGNIALKTRHVGVGTFTLTEEMRNSVLEVLDSGIISYGEKSKSFEIGFAKVHDCKYGILSNSGTSALLVALQALKEIHGWQDWDEVIVPATTFVATANIVLHCHLKPVFVDVDPLYYGMNPQLMKKAITPKTRAVIPVHLFGQSCDMTNIVYIARQNNLKIVEDSCEAMFVTHNGKKVGSMGDIGCFSTYVAHLIVTGVGGICTTNSPQYAAKVRSLVNHGLDIAFLNPDANYSPQPAVGRRFRFDGIGHSFRITEMEAALGLAQLNSFWKDLAIRARNARHYTAGLNIINTHYKDIIQAPRIMPGNTHAWMMYPILLRRGIDKEPLMQWLNDREIETRDMMPILGQPAYAYLDPHDFPVSSWIAESGFYVGTHQELEPDDVQYVLQSIEEWVATL